MKYILLALLTGLSVSLFAQNNVGIGTATPNPQAVLDIESPDKGILIPRITTAARTAFGSALGMPDNGMLVYDKDLNVFYYWDGTQWVLVGNGIGSDDQTITNFQLTGTSLQIDIEDGNSATVDLSSLQDGINDADADPTNEIQDLSFNATTNILTITNNGSATDVDLTPYLDNTDAQTLTLTGQNLAISNGNTVTLTDNVNDADSDPTNELQTISETGNTVTLSNGGGSFTDTDTDTQLTEAQVDAFTNNNGYLTSFTEVDGNVGNEYNTGASLSGTTLSVTDGGGAQTVNLSSLTVPAGAIMAFNLNTCPTGWAAANGTGGTPDLRGEFIRGLDAGRGVDVGRTLNSSQLDALQNITGSFGNVLYQTGLSSYNNTNSNCNGAFQTGSSSYGVYQGASGGAATVHAGPGEGFDFDASNVARTSTETRPRNVAFLYCVKQ